MSSSAPISENQELLAVFDLDKTLLKKNCSVYFFFFLLKRKFFPKISVVHYFLYFIRYRFFTRSMESLHEKVFLKFLKGKSITLLENEAEIFWKKYFAKLIRSSVLERLLRAKKEKAVVLILSASPEFLVAPVARKLQVSLYKGSRYDVDENKNISKILSFVHGSKKASYVSGLKKHFNIEKVSAYSDCISDLPLLQTVSNPICVKPDRRLASICKAHNWEMIKK